MADLEYEQDTGKFFRGTTLIGICYSGNGAGINNPELQHVKSVGPIPRGKYRLRLVLLPHKGPKVFALDKFPENNMLGRDGFLIHWDNPKKLLEASDGCLIPLTTMTFQTIFSGDILTVKTSWYYLSPSAERPTGITTS